METELFKPMTENEISEIEKEYVGSKIKKRKHQQVTDSNTKQRLTIDLRSDPEFVDLTTPSLPFNHTSPTNHLSSPSHLPLTTSSFSNSSQASSFSQSDMDIETGPKPVVSSKGIKIVSSGEVLEVSNTQMKDSNKVKKNKKHKKKNDEIKNRKLS